MEPILKLLEVLAISAPAIIAAISSLRNGRLASQHDKHSDQRAATILHQLNHPHIQESVVRELSKAFNPTTGKAMPRSKRLHRAEDPSVPKNP